MTSSPTAAPVAFEVPATRLDELLYEVKVDTEREPIFAQHRIDGLPTMPGMFAVETAVRAAAQLGFQTYPLMIEDIECLRFLRGTLFKPVLTYKVEARRFRRFAEERIVVRILTDIITSKGMTLAQDVIHFRMSVSTGHMSGSALADMPSHFSGGSPILDPHITGSEHVHLSGVFASLQNIVLTAGHARGAFSVPSLSQTTWESYLTPFLLLDSAMRMGVISASLYHQPEPAIIQRVARIILPRRINDLTLSEGCRDSLTLVADAIAPTGADGLGMSRCIAIDSLGGVVALVEGVQILTWKGRKHKAQ